MPTDSTSPAPTSPAPPTLDSLTAALDAELGTEGGRTERIVGRTAPVRRLGLALDPWPGLVDWVAGAGLDAVLLHRHWRWSPAGWPEGVALLATHDPFDRRYAFGRAPELTAALALAPGPPLGERDGWPLGTVGEGAPRSVAELRAALVAAFGAVEEELPAEPAPSSVTRVAMARAMTPQLVERAAVLGARVYLTGQVRARAVSAARHHRMHVLAVGHGRGERWALALLADALRTACPALDVRCAPE